MYKIHRESYLQDCIIACRYVKYIDSKVDWVNKKNQTGYLQCESALLDHEKKVIPNLWLRGNFNVQNSTGFKKLGIGLIYTGESKGRVIWLDVVPAHKTHMDKKSGLKIFGPHIHWGDENYGSGNHRVLAEKNCPDIENMSCWINRITALASLEFYQGGKITIPQLFKQFDLTEH